MRFSALITVWILTLVVGAPDRAIGQFERIFYFVDSESSWESFRSHTDAIDVVAPQSFKLDGRGRISGQVPARLITLARQNKINIMPLVVNSGFAAGVIDSLLAGQQIQAHLVSDLLSECVENGFVGIQFDFENIQVRHKAAFAAFIRYAAAAFHRQNLSLSLAVFPRTADFPGRTDYAAWYFEHKSGAYDYRILGESLDFLSVMTYDQHSKRTPPGPVAAQNWIESVVSYLLTKVPPEKLSLGIPLYSYHWFATGQGQGGKGMGYSEAAEMIREHQGRIIWDEQQKVTYSVFVRDDRFEHVYFEDVRSFAHKVDLIAKYRLRGFSAWRLGLEDPEIWRRPKQ